MIAALHIVMGISLLAGSYLLVRYVVRNRVISDTFQRTYTQLREQARLNSRYHEEKGRGKESFLHRLDKKLIYSGIRRRFPFLTAEMYLFLTAVSAAFGYILMLVASDSLFFAILALGCGPVALYGVLSALCIQSYQRTEDRLLVLLNLLESYSMMSSNIPGILYQVSAYIQEPVKSVLEECYFEAQTTGNVTGALEHTAEKLEHPQFRQLLRNLEVSSRYDADYSQVVRGSRRSMQDYLSYRKRRKSISNTAKAEMLFLIMTAVITFCGMGFVLGKSIWEMLFHTAYGNVLLAVMIAVLLLFYWQVVLFDKE